MSSIWSEKLVNNMTFTDLRALWMNLSRFDAYDARLNISEDRNKIQSNHQ